MVREEDLGYIWLLIAIFGNVSCDESKKLYKYDERSKVFMAIKKKQVKPVDVRPLPKSEIMELVGKLHEDGYSIAAIATALDVYPSRIKRYLNKYMRNI